jgi:cytochrome oxidase Cu insertion factor (SCO1/SenC/PrrC family)
MRRRFAVFALLAALVLGAASCASDPPDQGAAPAATTAPAPEPTSAPPTTRTPRTEAARPAPDGVVPAGSREPAPDLEVTAFDGQTVTLGGFRGQPVVVNFFESW